LFILREMNNDEDDGDDDDDDNKKISGSDSRHDMRLSLQFQDCIHTLWSRDLLAPRYLLDVSPPLEDITRTSQVVSSTG